MKSYTDLEQSKKLAEILPLESADMWFANGLIVAKTSKEPNDIKGVFPCWSLAALFEVMPKCVEGAEPSLIKTFRNDYRIVYDIHGEEDITSEDYTNPVDACVDMILRLKEQNLL